MILPSEKDNNLLDGKAEISSPSYLGDRQPESSSSYRATAPPTPFEDVPPPSYSNGPAISSNQSYYAPVNPTTVATMSVPRVPGMYPVSFSRVPPLDLRYPTFQPMFLVATGKTLDKGFPYTSPPSNSNPHPFASHDVTEGDWVSFLEDAQTAATLTEKQIGRSYLPIVSIVPIVGSLSSYGIRKVMKIRNASKFADCVDRWNRHFFEPRKLKVLLMKGQVKVSGQSEHSGTSASRNSESEYQKQGGSSSIIGNNQELVDMNDDIYRLFIIPLS